MPYKNISELPDAVKNALPEPAQKIFLKAFNSAFAEYKGDEEAAMKVAWAAVKKKFKKEGDKWVAKKGEVKNSIVPDIYTRIRGVAVSKGTYPMTGGDTIDFDDEVLNQIAEKLIGVKIYADTHKVHEFSNLVGEVTNTWVDDDKVKFDADVVSSHYSDLMRKYEKDVKFSLGTKIITTGDTITADPFELIMTQYPRDPNAELKEILNTEESNNEEKGGIAMDDKEKKEYEEKISELLNTISAYEIEKKTAIADNILAMQKEMGVELDESEALLSMSVEEIARYEKTVGKFHKAFEAKEVLNTNEGSGVSTEPAENVGKEEPMSYAELRKKGLGEKEALRKIMR